MRKNAFVFTLIFGFGVQGVLFGQDEKQVVDHPQIPCNEASWEGDDYYRAVGFGEHPDASESMYIARDEAVKDVLNRVFSEFYYAVDKSLGECVCLDTCREPDGLYQTIVVYDIPKETLMLHYAEALVNAQIKINKFYRELYWRMHEREFRERAMEFFEKTEKDKKEDK